MSINYRVIYGRRARRALNGKISQAYMDKKTKALFSSHEKRNNQASGRDMSVFDFNNESRDIKQEPGRVISNIGEEDKATV